jgi:hypothetical protein
MSNQARRWAQQMMRLRNDSPSEPADHPAGGSGRRGSRDTQRERKETQFTHRSAHNSARLSP